MLPSAPTGWNRYVHYNAEYRAAVRALDLELPDGVTLPRNAPTDTEPDVLYEAGMGEVTALFAWLGAVEVAAVTAHRAGDAAEARRWTLLAAQFSEHPTYVANNDYSVLVSWHDDVVVPALAGDFGPMAEDCGLDASG